MIKTSELYQQLFKEGAVQEYRVNIDGKVYQHEIIKDSVSLHQNLLDKSTFTVGSLTISVLKLKLNLPSEEIPHNASVVFSYRYNNGEVQSEWVDKFKGNVTQRTKYTEEATSIEAKDRASNYDVFLDYFGDAIDKYPANTRKVAQLCASHLGLSIENINDVINEDIVEYPNELTMVEVLKNIARNSGGNWTIVGDQLRLVTTGTEYHTFIKYADDEDGNGMSDNEEGKSYYGIYYGITESNNKEDYAWYEIPSDVNLLQNSNFVDGGEHWEIDNGQLETKAVSTRGTLGLKQVVGNPNLIENGWDDFKIYGNKPNLIPNGWDSFEPYGSGTNYVENWNFAGDDLREFSNYSNSMSIRNGVLLVEATADNVASWIRLTNIKYIGEVIVRVKIKAPNGARLSGGSGTDSNSLPIASSDKFEVHELSLTINSDTYNRIYVYTSDKSLGAIGDKIEIDWIQITPVDNQHLVVEKTPLENGLTRIQTWGGSGWYKLTTPYVDKNATKDSERNWSFYIKNNNEPIIVKPFDSTAVQKEVPKGYDGFFAYSTILPRDFDGGYAVIQAKSKNDNLDFIASDPQIVEGDVPNLTLIKTPLGNGRTRIQTFGGGDNIKLRYEKPFEDKDLTFSTYLENNSEEPMGIKVLDNEEKTYAPNFKGMVEEYGKG